MRSRWIIVLVLLLGSGGGGWAVYAEEAEHGSEPHAGGHHEAGEATMPETPKEIWHAVMEEQESLEQTIAGGKLAEVHKVAFHIRDLVQALPTVSMDLPADKKQRLQDSVTRVAEIAGLLDQYGDAGDAVNTTAQADRLAKLLKYIETLYPEGTLHAVHTEGQGQAGTHHGAHQESEPGHDQEGSHY